MWPISIIRRDFAPEFKPSVYGCQVGVAALSRRRRAALRRANGATTSRILAACHR